MMNNGLFTITSVSCKRRLFTITPVEKDHGPSKMKGFKGDIHQKKLILLVRWDWRGVVYFELLPRNQTFNSNIYRQQLGKLNTVINEKRPELINRKGVIFHQDNARPHTSLVIRQKLRELDLAPSDYHLFLSLQKSSNGKTFDNDEAIKSHFVQFIAEKNQKFFERGIMNLPKIWQKVIEQNGKYIIELNN